MTLRRFAPFFLLALLLALPAPAQADGRVVSAIGVKQVNGESLYVDVVVAVPPGKTARQATDKALTQQGASRVKPGGGGTGPFAYTGLKWNPPSVTQYYNRANEPLDAQGDLVNTYSDWSNVPHSAYTISSGGTTNRCPSLVNKCHSRPNHDGLNDVGWLPLGGSTLGVTWYTISDPEADMVLNPRFTWNDTCNSSGSDYDVETVFLHENGHVAGLAHTTRTDSVMYPSYLGPECSLHDYDKDALANLYPQ